MKVMGNGLNRHQSLLNKLSSQSEVINSINAGIGAINDINNHIVSAAEEQPVVAEEINRNINNISVVSEQFSIGPSNIKCL